MKHLLLEYQVVLFLALLAPVYLILRRRTASPRRLFLLCGLFALAVLLGLSLVNLGRPGFLWHDEPNILSISAAYLHGEPIYHGRTSVDLYSLLYGPSTFLIYLPLLKFFSQPMLAIRLAGFAVDLTILTLLYLLLRRRLSPAAALALLPLPIAYLLSLPSHIFGVRGDQVLLLCFAAALLAVETLPLLSAALIAGVLCGFALDFKITVAPVVCLLLAVLFRRTAASWKAALLAAAVALATASSLFLLPGISLHNYFSWLVLSGHQGFEREPFLATILAAAFLLAPGLMLQSRRIESAMKRDAFSDDLLLRALFFVALAGCIVAGSKNGAGPWHLWPMLPFILLWTAEAAANSGVDSPREEAHSRQLAGAIAVAAMLVTLRAGYRDFHVLHPPDAAAMRAAEDAQRSEIRDWIGRFPGRNLAMGYGSSVEDPRSAERFRLPLAGEDYFLDESALVESIKAGSPMPTKLQSRILGCGDVWLVPHGEQPFATLRAGVLPPSQQHPYLFPDAIRLHFTQTHTRIATGGNYDAWTCPSAGVGAND